MWHGSSRIKSDEMEAFVHKKSSLCSLARSSFDYLLTDMLKIDFTVDVWFGLYTTEPSAACVFVCILVLYEWSHSSLESDHRRKFINGNLKAISFKKMDFLWYYCSTNSGCIKTVERPVARLLYKFQDKKASHPKKSCFFSLSFFIFQIKFLSVIFLICIITLL